MPHALKVLRDHDVLNGIGCSERVGELPCYYKAQGLTDECAKKVAVYLLHCSDGERQWYFDKMMAGGATTFQIAKISTEYKRALKDIKLEHRNKVRRQDVLVIDAGGRLH